MEGLRERLIELFKVGIFAFAGFGVAMFLGFLLSWRNGLESIPTMAVAQTIIYTVGITGAVIVFLTDIVTEKVSQKIKNILFFITLYVLGLVLFQCRAPIGPFDRIAYFFAFSLWILYMSGIGFLGWFIYSRLMNQKYKAVLEKYKCSLQEGH